MATVLFANTFIWKLLPCKANKPWKLKSSLVFDRAHSSLRTTGSHCFAHVCKYHNFILSVNFNGQQQRNKSFDVTEINLWLEFVDVILGGTSDSRKNVCVRRLNLISHCVVFGGRHFYLKISKYHSSSLRTGTEHLINGLITKARPRWLDIGQVFFWCVYGPRQSLGPQTHKKRMRPILSHCNQTNLVNKGFSTWISGKFFLQDMAGSLEWASSILPAWVSNHRAGFDSSCPLRELAT